MKIKQLFKLEETVNVSTNCSTENGLSRLKVLSSNTHFVLLSTMKGSDDKMGYTQFSLLGRLSVYVLILGFMLIVIAIYLKYLGIFDEESANIDGTTVTATATTIETRPLIPGKEVPCIYGATEEGASDSSFHGKSSDEFYDGKICVICYEDRRNCFFAPCGHCATCFTCAQRIVGGENKACPICRRPIQEVRKLFKT